jgi:hypothetical protein
VLNSGTGFPGSVRELPTTQPNSPQQHRVEIGKVIMGYVGRVGVSDRWHRPVTPESAGSGPVDPACAFDRDCQQRWHRASGAPKALASGLTRNEGVADGPSSVRPCRAASFNRRRNTCAVMKASPHLTSVLSLTPKSHAVVFRMADRFRRTDRCGRRRGRFVKVEGAALRGVQRAADH